MKGRKAYPFQVIQSTNQKDRYTAETLKAREENQPEINTAKLICPEHMSTVAKLEWKRITELYKELKSPIINDLDLNALEIYCEAVATYQKAMQEVNKTTEVYMTSTGPKKNPWLTVANDAALIVKRYGESLLMDPVSRARVGLAKAKSEELSPIAKLRQQRQENG